MWGTKCFQSPFHSTTAATSNSSHPYFEHDSYITTASQYFWMLWCGIFILGSAAALRQQAETKAHMTKWGLELFVQLKKEVAKNQLWPLFTYGHRGIYTGSCQILDNLGSPSPRDLCVLRFPLSSPLGQRVEHSLGLRLVRWLPATYSHKFLCFLSQRSVWPV